MEMTQEEMKHNIIDWAKDVSVAVESFARDIKFEIKTSTVEADLQEAKTSAKKLIKKIDKSLKPEFEVGDYATYEGIIENKIAKIDSINENELHGLWYEQEKEGIRQDWWFKGGHTVRHATPEEIAEYEVALTFHKHGRNPFELKCGDLIKVGNSNRCVENPYMYIKEMFYKSGYELLATAEEVNEWLENK